MKTEVTDHRQLLLRFALALGMLSCLVAGGVWKKNALFAEQQELETETLRLAEMSRAMYRAVLFVHGAQPSPESAPLDRGRLADDLGREITALGRELEALVAAGKSAGGTRPAGDVQSRLAALFFGAPLRLDVQLRRFLDEAEALKRRVASPAVGEAALQTSLVASAHRLRRDMEELTTGLDSVRTQLVLQSHDRVAEMDRLFVVAVFLLLVFFAGMGMYIIFPTKRLLKAQQQGHVEAMRSLSERNDELGQSQESLALQKRILQSVLDSVGEAVIVFHREGTLQLQNPAADRLFGRFEMGTPMSAWHESAGLTERETGAAIDPDTSPLAVALRGDSVSGRLLVVRNAEQADAVYVLGAGQPMFDERGRQLGAVLSFHDVTERVRNEMQLERAKGLAEGASRAKSEFLANISHEIRTPMTAILGYADMLLRPTLNSDQRSRNVKIIRRNGRMLMKLIDDLLDISKIEAGRLDVEKTRVALAEIVSEVYSLLHCRAQEKNIDLRIQFEGKLPRVLYTDPVRLRQVLINIVGNAIKFTEVGSVTLTIRYLATMPVNALEFAVADTGCGLSDAAVRKLFSPFVQVDTTTTRRHGGTGLGLALSKRLAKALGGDLLLERSTPGQGSTFVARVDPGTSERLELVEGVSLKDAFASCAEADERLPSSGLEGLKILVVDDSPENRDLVACYLETAGALVVTATDGEDGVGKALNEAFDAILMDVQMPRMDGYQAVSQLRERRYPAPIIALTAHAMDEERTRCRDAGFDEYLVKPIDAAMLVNVVGRMGRVVKALGPSALERDSIPDDPGASRAKAPPTEPPTESPTEGGGEWDMLDLGRLESASPRVLAIVERFVDGVGKEISTMRVASGAGDRDRVAKLAHKLKGSAGSCGFPGLMRRAHLLERVAKAPDGTRELGPEVDQLAAWGERSAAAFRRWLGTRAEPGAIGGAGPGSQEITI